MSAYKDLIEYLEKDEEVEGIVFGPFGWGSAPEENEEWKRGFDEPNPPPVPLEKRGKVLTIKEARQFMEGWEFYGGFGGPESYAVYIWTNQRVIWVTQYDGATSLDSAPRNPLNIIPDMPGG